MAESQGGKSAGDELAQVNQLRAGTYDMLSALLADVPTAGVIQSLASLAPVSDDDSPLATGWEALRVGAQAADHDRLGREFQSLFAGLENAELTPFACWYLDGKLMSRPLSNLRDDLARLGISRQQGVRETEDHIAALSAAMSLAIRAVEDISFEQQKQFFETHLQPWATRFYQDLQRADSADFYQSVGCFGERFMAFETTWFSLTD